MSRVPETLPQSHPRFHVVLRPHRSLGPVGFWVLMGAVCAVSFAAGLIFYRAGAYRLDRVPELMEDYKNIVMRYWKPSDPKISYALAMSGTHIQGPLPFGRATTIEFDFWWDPGNPEQVKRAILTLRQMGEMMMDHGVMFAKNLVGTYELLPRLGTYFDLVCRAKAMTDPLHIMHPDVMPVGKGYSPPSD